MWRRGPWLAQRGSSEWGGGGLLSCAVLPLFPQPLSSWPRLCPALVLEFGQAPLPPPFPGSQEGFRAGHSLVGVVSEEDRCPAQHSPFSPLLSVQPGRVPMWHQLLPGPL